MILSLITILIKLTRGVCRGLPCYSASPEKLFSFWEKATMGLHIYIDLYICWWDHHISSKKLDQINTFENPSEIWTRKGKSFSKIKSHSNGQKGISAKLKSHQIIVPLLIKSLIHDMYT